MASPATHLLFAMDLESHLLIQDPVTYHAGSLYPDSRYFTGISRERTHGPHCPRDPFATGLSDFERGWATHLLYDERVSSRLVDMIPASYPRTREHDGFDPWWVYLTAMKLVEDEQSWRRRPDVLTAMRAVAAPIAPNQEEVNEVLEYYSALQRTYRAEPSGEDQLWLLKRLKIPADRAELLVETLMLLQRDEAVCAQIAMMYPTFLQTILAGR